MDEVREDRHNTDRYVWAASTTGGSPLGAAAALAVLTVLSSPGVYEQLRTTGDRLRAGITDVVRQHDLPVVTYGHGPLVQYRISDVPVRDLLTEQKADGSQRRAVDLAMVEQGVFINPMLTKIYVSLAHDDTAISHYLDALSTAITALRGL
jgi:glutamate-1-semialdehyde 2,1-aminomutase